MKISSFLLLFLFCHDSSVKNYKYFIPADFQYPLNKIGLGKIFVYQNPLTKLQNYQDLKTVNVGGQSYQIVKSYDSSSIFDSTKILDGKVIETYNYVFNKGGNPVNEHNVQDTIINTGEKLGMRLTEDTYQTDHLLYVISSQEQFLKDTTINWEGFQLSCLVTEVKIHVQMQVTADTSRITPLMSQKIRSEHYYAKGIGRIKYSVQFVDHNGKNNYNLWELKSINNIVN